MNLAFLKVGAVVVASGGCSARNDLLSASCSAPRTPLWRTQLKVNKKIFVFLGLPAPGEAGGFGVKLRESHEQALAIGGAAPTGYGLGKAGWVWIDLGGDIPSLGVLTDFVEESYRIVVPKRLVTQLDGGRRAPHLPRWSIPRRACFSPGGLVLRLPRRRIR